MLISELMEQVRTGSLLNDARPFAGDEVFIERIREFERVYQMEWYIFLGKITHQELVAMEPQERLDYAEWKMLCEKFSDQLEDGLTIMASPPLCGAAKDGKGPSNRAFSFANIQLNGPPPSDSRQKGFAFGRSNLLHGSRKVCPLL